MTERQAWKTIADAYATPKRERTEDQVRLAESGICGAALSLWLYYKEIDNKQRNQITRIITDSMPNNPYCDSAGGRWFCAPIPANDKLRADFCYLQYYKLGGK